MDLERQAAFDAQLDEIRMRQAELREDDAEASELRELAAHKLNSLAIYSAMVGA